jgi:ribA/ribD-fused uncharacterized protein
MMAEKARLFGDAVALDRILQARNPAVAKAAGREVQGFDEEVWAANRWDIVVQANYAKFAQNAPLRDFLLATGEQVLVEASPVDFVWGTGFAADSPYASENLASVLRQQSIGGFRNAALNVLSKARVQLPS